MNALERTNVKQSKIGSLILLLFLTACGSGSGKSSSNITNPVPTPIPSPTPDPFIGQWMGQDWSPADQDIVSLNSNGTGSLLNCGWTFSWTYANPITLPNNLVFSNIVSPVYPPADKCNPNGTPRNIPYSWINQNTVSLKVYWNATYTYVRQ